MRTLSRSARLTVGAAAAALALGLGVTVSAAATSSSSSASPSSSRTVFTVGITADIDSANPFTGIVAEAYEIY